MVPYSVYIHFFMFYFLFVMGYIAKSQVLFHCVVLYFVPPRLGRTLFWYTLFGMIIAQCVRCLCYIFYIFCLNLYFNPKLFNLKLSLVWKCQILGAKCPNINLLRYWLFAFSIGRAPLNGIVHAEDTDPCIAIIIIPNKLWFILHLQRRSNLSTVALTKFMSSQCILCLTSRTTVTSPCGTE